jgi:hypothetical protein
MPEISPSFRDQGLRHLPELTVVWTKEIDALLSHRTFLRRACLVTNRS